MTRFNIAILQDLLKINASQQSSYTRSTLCTSTYNTQKNEFRMPERIQRSSTDILKALDSTIKWDKSGPHYRYHDDPYLSPVTGMQKRMFSLSKESGRKAASWIKDSNPDLFNHLRDDPVIKAFRPVEEFTEESTVTEHTLQELVATARVADAVTVYKLCRDKNIDVSPEVQQSLLELLCFYNEEDPPSDEWQEERDFSKSLRPGKETTNTWRTDGVADQLFLQLQDSAPAHNAIIRGHARHCDVDDAWRLYHSALAASVPLSADTYNAVLATANMVNNNFEECWDIVATVLKTMASHGVQPNLETLNNSLQILSIMTAFRKGRIYSMQLMKEFQLLGVQPSLATYFFLLTINCRNHGSKNNLLYNILDELEKEEGEFPLRDHRDNFFFMQAMDTCSSHLKSLDAANRLHRLLEVGNNEKYLNNSLKRTVYYHRYLLLALESLPLQEFMELYDQLVPHVYSVDRDLMQAIITSAGVQGRFDYLPMLWTDLCAVNLHNVEAVITSLLTAMCHYQAEDQPDTPDGDVGLNEQLGRIVQHLVEQIKEEAEPKEGRRYKSPNHMQWTSMQGGQLMQIISLVGGAKTGGDLLQVLLQHPAVMVGEVLVPDVQLLLDTAIREDDPDTALVCATYCNEFDPTSGKEMAKQVISTMKLEAQHRAKLAIRFGISRPTDDLPESSN